MPLIKLKCFSKDPPPTLGFVRNPETAAENDSNSKVFHKCSAEGFSEIAVLQA